MKTLILADVHLKVNDAGAKTREEFVRFLRGIDPAEFDRIVILGDLFDFWFEYKQVIFSGFFEVLCALKSKFPSMKTEGTAVPPPASGRFWMFFGDII